MSSDRVGPVLLSCALGEAVLAAIRESTPELEVLDRGAYLRVLAPRRCVARRDAIERHTGAAFHLPADLEPIMPSFAGRFAVSAAGDEVVWEAWTR
jgi:hypothetical protein